MGKYPSAHAHTVRHGRKAANLTAPDNKNQIKRLKNVEMTIPIVHGTISFWQGTKADLHHTHKWTVYIRGATNEDLGVAVKRVIFKLHSSFEISTRVVESPPFEVSETGWGEFDIFISIFFHSDVGEEQLELIHPLKLVPENEPPSVKKPVVAEFYDEIVIAEPSEYFYLRACNHPAVTVSGTPTGLGLPLPSGSANDTFSKKKNGDTKDHPLSQWFLKHSEADELAQLRAAREQVQNLIMKSGRQLNCIETEDAELNSNSNE